LGVCDKEWGVGKKWRAEREQGYGEGKENKEGTKGRGGRERGGVQREGGPERGGSKVRRVQREGERREKKLNKQSLGPDAEGGVPGAGAEGIAVVGDAEAGDAVGVASEGLNEFASEGVPNVAVVVVVAGEEVAAREGEGDRSDAGVELSRGVGHELRASAEIEEAASGVVRACTEGIARWEELHRIDIGRMT